MGSSLFLATTARIGGGCSPRRKVATCTIMAVVVATASIALGESTSPGKSSVYATADNIALNTVFYSPIVSATLTKGKKNRVLEIDVTLVDRLGTATALGVGLNVNSTAEGHYPAQRGSCATAFAGCTVHALFWVDLDAEELNVPGLYINQPLVISVNGFSMGSDAAVDASLRARLIKK